jgi:hypothetical protein
MVGMSLAAFRERIADVLTLDQRRRVVHQAVALLESVYAHLWHKRAMYAIDPVQQLRLLERRLPELSDEQFHAEMHQVLVGLRDGHTSYRFPGDYQTHLASLGIMIERYWQDGKPHWLISKINRTLVTDAELIRGADVTHWNGSPIGVAVARHSELEVGGNEAARLARGLERMTERVLLVSPLPDEDWVDLRFVVGDAAKETRLFWRVGTANELLPPTVGSADALAPDTTPPPDLDLGLDLRTELVRRIKKAQFAPVVTDEERSAAGDLAPRRPELRYRTVNTAHGEFGHLRIDTFHMKDADIAAFLAEMRRLLALVPRRGLILDVRGNGGGYVRAAEFLLQFFTPRPVQPEPAQFINTTATASMCAEVTVPDLSAWSASINQSLKTGAQYSSAIPIDKVDDLNSVGQIYHGPVVLVTDALCYSATDTFAAGFADHRIGPILGIDESTGAGGANVWELDDFLTRWPSCPFEPLAKGASLRVAIRRTLRVGAHAGQLIEDLGVTPTHRHPISRRDLLEGNEDLMQAAGALLAEMTPRRLDVVAQRDVGHLTLTLTTEALTSVDIYVDGRPAATAPVADGQNTASVTASEIGAVVIRVAGFVGTDLVAARTVHVAG